MEVAKKTGGAQKVFRLPRGLKYPKKAPHSERGTNAGKSRFIVICGQCPQGNSNLANQYGADLNHPPKECPRGHSLPHRGWPRT